MVLPKDYDPWKMEFREELAESNNAEDFKDESPLNLEEIDRKNGIFPNHEEKKEEKLSSGSDSITGILMKSAEGSKSPARKFNPYSMELEYADPRLQKIAELRRKTKNKNRDTLAGKQQNQIIELEYSGLGLSKEDLGKTGDSRTGEVSDKHKKTASIQVEAAKEFMKRKDRGR